jgi:hypothetical protein
MENLKCPMCETSDFKDENGYYVCQICGHKIPKESPTSTSGSNNTSKVQISLILGILGIVFAWLFAIVGHAVSIIGIVLGNKEKKETGKNTGLVISIIGEICAVLSSLIGIISMM